MQLNTRLKALDEIYKIYTRLHLWNPVENHEKRFGQASSGQSTQCPGKEASQPHQLGLREPRKGSAHVHAALPAEEGTTLIQKMKCLRRGERRPEGAKKHAILQVRVRTAKYPFLILWRETREHPFLSFFQILVRLGTAENATYHTDESQ